MRLAFWRRGGEKAQAAKALAKPAPAHADVAGATEAGDLDLRSLGAALSRRKSLGRLERSVEMMTQRPVMGSRRRSGMRENPTDSDFSGAVLAALLWIL